MNDPNVDPSEYRDWGAFSSIIVYATVSFVFCFLHGANYEPNYSLYWLIWSFFFFWMVKCFRDFVVVPSNPILLGLVCIYDIIFRRPFLRNHLVLQVVAFFGFQNTEYFSLMLLDIFSVSPLLQDIIRSFTVPLPKLGLVLFVTLATTFIFVSFGFQSFYGRESDDENGGSQWRAQDGKRDSVRPLLNTICTFLLWPSGGTFRGSCRSLISTTACLAATLRSRVFPLDWHHHDEHYHWPYPRHVSSLREEADARAEILSSTCFICGIVSSRTIIHVFLNQSFVNQSVDLPTFSHTDNNTDNDPSCPLSPERPAYEDINLPAESTNFDVHAEKEHNLWNYVYYIAFLLEKDSMDYNGIESMCSVSLKRLVELATGAKQLRNQEFEKAGIIDASDMTRTSLPSRQWHA